MHKFAKQTRFSANGGGAMKRRLACAATMLMFPCVTLSAAKQMTLVCSGYSGSTVLTGFQTLVRLPDGVENFSYGDYAPADGSDIWFEDSNGNLIPHELDVWNASGSSYVWVRIPSLVDSSTSIVMHWGAVRTAEQTCTASDTWDGFVGVWHMNEADGDGEQDSTANGLDASLLSRTGGSAKLGSVDGKIGAGRESAQSAHLQVGSASKPYYADGRLTDVSKFTVCGWWSRTEAGNSYPRFVSSCGNQTGYDLHGWELYVNGSAMRMRSGDGSANAEYTSGVSLSAPSGWVYLTAVWDGTSAQLYTNGVSGGSSTLTKSNTSPKYFFTIGGGYFTSDRGLVGGSDEVRMYNGVQGSDRIAADFATMNSPTTFLVSRPDILTLAEGEVLDLAGGSLAVGGLAGAGTITNSADGVVATLRVVTESGVCTTNDSVLIAGNILLRKDGEGTFCAAKSGQSYFGGTEIAAGTLVCGADGTTCPLGSTNGTVRVSSGAVLEMNGMSGFHDYSFALNGGTMRNSTAVSGSSIYRMWGNVALEADSAISVVQGYGLSGADGDSCTRLDLGKCKLSVDIATGQNFYLCNTTVTNGEISISSSGWLYVNGSEGTMACDVDFSIGCGLKMQASLTVRDYESTREANNNTGTGTLRVCRTFRPSVASGYFYGCTMADDSTMDFSAWAANGLGWPVKSKFSSGRREIGFESGATVHVSFGEELGGVKASAEAAGGSLYILKWEDNAAEKPGSDVSFVLDGDTGDYVLSVDATGLRFCKNRGLIIIIM